MIKSISRFLAVAALALVSCSTSAQVTTDSLVNIQKAKHYTELWGQRAALFNALGCDSTSIVMLGNSLTHGNEWHEFLGNPKVLNRGINGDIIEGITDRIDCVVDGHPAKIFLMVGTNDVSHNLTADSIATAAGKLIDLNLTRTPNTKLYVQSLLPINNSFGRYKAMKDKEQVIRDINALLRPMAEAKGCTWVEVHERLVDADVNLRKEWTNDGLHLLPEAYAVWREVLLPFVNE